MSQIKHLLRIIYIMKKILLLIIFTCTNAYSLEITLDEFQKKVLEQNINLKIALTDQQIKTFKSNGIRIPAPMISAITGKTNLGNSKSGFEIDQYIPFPGKISADHNFRILESKSELEKTKALQNEILAESKRSYIDLFLMQKRIEVILLKRSILLEHIKLARSAVRSDSFLKIHLLKAQSDLDLLENELESSKQMLKEKQFKLAEIINEDQQQFIPVAIDPGISAIPRMEKENKIPQLESLKFNLESMKEKESEAKASWMPDFNLKYRQMNETNMSGKDTELMVGITLPFLFFWQADADLKVANTEKLEAELLLHRETRSIDTKMAALYLNLESLQKQILNLKNNLIPRAEERMKIVHNLAPRDMETIQDKRETMEVLPELKMKEIDLRMQYEESITQLEKYLSPRG